MGKQVEVEGGELAIRNSNGDIAIIPKKYRLEVEGMIKDGCHSCIDKFVSSLPKMHDYAQDGTVIPDDNKTNGNNQTYKEYRASLEALQPGLGTETSDYNLRGAWEGGLEPQKVEDGTYHLGSRNPKTGLLLKSVDHPTFDKMIEGERQAGYEVYQDDNGSYYSYKSANLMLDDFKKSVDFPPELLRNHDEEEAEINETRTIQEDIGDNLKILSKRLLNTAKTFGASAIGDALYGIDPDLADYVSNSTFGMISPTKIDKETPKETYNDFSKDAAEANLMFFAGEGTGIAVSKLASKYGARFLDLFKGKSNKEIRDIIKTVDNAADKLRKETIVTEMTKNKK